MEENEKQPVIDVLIPVLQDLANQARFIMGQKTVEYSPMPEGKKRKPKKKAIKASHGTVLPRRP